MRIKKAKKKNPHLVFGLSDLPSSPWRRRTPLASAQSFSPSSINSECEIKKQKRNSTLGFWTFRLPKLTKAASNPAFFGSIVLSEVDLLRMRNKKVKKKNPHLVFGLSDYPSSPWRHRTPLFLGSIVFSEVD